MPPQDEFSGLTEEELIALLGSLGGVTNGGIPGKSAANKLNYYQDLISTLGFDPVQQAGIDVADQPPPEEYVPGVNKQRYIYESDPTYKQIFDLIDQGASPATAVSEADLKDDQAKEAQKVATDYAGSVVDEMNSRQKFETSQAAKQKKASYTAADGSKYKNAPLGGNDVFGTASEYDLLGQPSIDELAQQLGQTRLAQTPGLRTHNTRGGPVAVGAGTKATDTMVSKAYGNESGVTRAATRNAAADRITKAKNTQVRSDANTNAMRRILALRTVLGG
jgi:hypothetical protein